MSPLPPETTPRIAESLEVLAGVAVERESHDEAGRLFGAARAVRAVSAYHYCVNERDSDLSQLRTALGSDRLKELLEEGRNLSFDEAIAYARRGRDEPERPDAG
jgi:hypothetical protein